MKFSVSLSNLNHALQKVSPALPRKTTLPILEHFYFILEDDTLRIIATDQSITIMNQIIVNSSENGKILVPGKRITDIIRALDNEQEITFNANLETYEISIRTTFGKYTMKGLDPEDYLELPELFQSQKPEIGKLVEPLSDDEKNLSAMISAKDLTWAAERTFFCVSKDDFKPAMTGVYFQFQGNRVNIVSTDSYRLSKTTVEADGQNIFPTDLSVIIPSRTVELLRKVEDDVLISFVKADNEITHTRFDIGDTVLITRIIDERYPKYESVIPTSNPYELKINKKDILPALKRVSLFASPIGKPVKLEISTESLTLVGQDEDSGLQGQETIPCHFNSEKFVIGFNNDFLQEAIENMVVEGTEEEVIISLSEPTRPVLVKPNIGTEKLLMLLMPLRLGD